jgi:tripeptidyl-peptidase-1
MHKLAVLLLLLVLGVYGRVDRYERSGAPKGWTYLGRAENPQQSITFSLALPQRNLNVLEDKLNEIANPKNPSYSKWLSYNHVMDIISTPEEMVAPVREWLLANGEGLLNVQFGGDYFQVKATIAYVERLFETTIHTWKNDEKGFLVNKHLGKLSVPEKVSESIVMITGITEFPPKKLSPIKHVARDTESCNVPPSMRSLYNLTDDDISDPDVMVAPFAQAAYGSDGFGEAALLVFETICGFPKNPLNGHLGEGPYTPKYDDDEAQLDMQMLSTLGAESTLDFFIVQDDQWMYEYALQFASLVANNTKVPYVNTMSYAWWETDECSNASYPFLGQCQAEGIPNAQVYVNRTNTEFMKFSSMGYTFVAASGDDGTGGTHFSSNCSFTHPLFPAASPYVVSVGATVTAPGTKLPGGWTQPICNTSLTASCSCNTQGSEIMCGQDTYGGFDSGGGFSVYVNRPSWQDAAVSNYLSSAAKRPCAACFNSNGRGYPDVAAIGGNVGVYYGGYVSLIGGTSASCPIVGGMLATLNALRLKAGKNVLGYVNPLLYQAAADCPHCFTDITSGGSNPGECPDMGFETYAGWDPTTGLGSLNFGNLRDYIMTLP